MKLESFGRATRFGRFKRFVERFGCMRVPIIPHDLYHFDLRILFLQFLHEMGKIRHGVLLRDADMTLSGQRFTMSAVHNK